MNTSVRRNLLEKLKNKVYRDAYVDQDIRNGIASQIRAMRESRGWTQSELGQRAGMAQETISQLEDPEYGRVTLGTLKRLASAFDVALTVRFAPFSGLVARVSRLSADDLDVPDFHNDRLPEEPPQRRIAVR